jgi:hypothetical protein
MVGMSSKLRPSSFIFILGKREKSQGARLCDYGGWDTTGLFLGQKLLNGNGGVRRSIVMVKKPTTLKKLAAFLRRF